MAGGCFRAARGCISPSASIVFVDASAWGPLAFTAPVARRRPQSAWAISPDRPRLMPTAHPSLPSARQRPRDRRAQAQGEAAPARPSLPRGPAHPHQPEHAQPERDAHRAAHEPVGPVAVAAHALEHGEYPEGARHELECGRRRPAGRALAFTPYETRSRQSAPRL
ncbi:hypothetical protein CALCODRAFT_246739 [Calocera cornea HHB12733]|uniref:Uncharacterized protein n=1 Tax=Calocera cornea HHB12733 TaxID=1353952 RepID=A0A165JUY5_9BASI|nr:hypothetical protein CALCODRAFT_246739 [Calocera cornea HHB12733]